MELIKKCGTSVILGVGTPQLVDEDEDSDWRNQTEEVGICLNLLDWVSFFLCICSIESNRRSPRLPSRSFKNFINNELPFVVFTKSRLSLTDIFVPDIDNIGTRRARVWFQYPRR